MNINLSIYLVHKAKCSLDRAVGRSKNPGVPVLYGGHNLTVPLGLGCLVEIGLTDLPKSGGASTPNIPRDDTLARN